MSCAFHLFYYLGDSDRNKIYYNGLTELRGKSRCVSEILHLTFHMKILTYSKYCFLSVSIEAQCKHLCFLLLPRGRWITLITFASLRFPLRWHFGHCLIGEPDGGTRRSLWIHERTIVILPSWKRSPSTQAWFTFCLWQQLHECIIQALMSIKA